MGAFLHNQEHFRKSESGDKGGRRGVPALCFRHEFAVSAGHEPILQLRIRAGADGYVPVIACPQRGKFFFGSGKRNVGFRRFDFCHRGAVVTKRVGAGDIVQDKRAGKSADKVAGKLRQNIVIRGAGGLIYARRGFAEADKPF